MDPAALFTASSLERAHDALTSAADLWRPGELVECSGDLSSAVTTMGAAAVRSCQLDGQPVAWVQYQDAGLYPPDLEEAGVDLDTLVVVHIPTTRAPMERVRAAELLLQSGGFGLVVLDLRHLPPRRHSTAWQRRLTQQAREHTTGVLLLTHTRDDGPSTGPLVHTHVSAARLRRPNGYAVAGRVLKRKGGGALDGFEESRRGPWGLV